MIENIKPKFDDKILVVGVGSGREIKIISDYVRKVYGVDISKKFLKHCEKKFGDNFEGSHCDIETEKVIYDDEYFDKIVCINVLPYFGKEGLKNYFNEMARVMKKDGTMFIMILNKRFPFSEEIQRNMIRDRLKANKAIYFFHNLEYYSEIFNKYGLFIKYTEGGIIYTSTNSRLDKVVCNQHLRTIIINLMNWGGKTPLKNYYKNLYLLLNK
jgi:cyclopropane fatty-acyl-phospholipid synthase-like methyltransferase|tara:strand:- start:3861 stop:4499 length:639 start_codon:yes stop_codon:yes gene_type:complete